MAKRFTDTEKWKKQWFRKLSSTHKCFWQYLVDNCNHAGIWEVDFELASIFIGEDLEEEHIRMVFEKQFVELNSNKRWFIKDFVEFQYGDLNSDNRAHNSVINILKKEGVYKGLISPLQERKDKDKDKVKDKDNVYSVEFQKFWKAYPRKISKKKTQQAWTKISPSKEVVEKIIKAVEKYKTTTQWKEGNGKYIPHPTTFLNQARWEDEIVDLDDSASKATWTCKCGNVIPKGKKCGKCQL